MTDKVEKIKEIIDKFLKDFDNEAHEYPIGILAQQIADLDEPPSAPGGATCHYERDKEGKWWLVWGADFDQDEPGRKLVKDSLLLESGYQQAKSELPQPDEGEVETRQSLAEGHGITFPNAEEAIKWLKSG